MLILTFDLETIPCQDAQLIADWRTELTAEMELAKLAVKAPANYKDQEKIDAYIADKINELVAGLDAALEAKVVKTSFDGLYGRIACIAWAFGGGEVQCTSHKSTEAEVITEFYTAVESALEINYHGGSTSTPLQVCGHNLAGFDLPFLKARSIILGIKPPLGLWAAMNAKPWDKCIQDTMLLWNSDSQKRASMDKLCRALGIKGKDGFDGSMVAETWPVDPQKVIEYCRDDVERTRQIYKRIMFFDGDVSAPARAVHNAADANCKLNHIIKTRCSIVVEPYSLSEILDQIETNEYSAELMLQHLLIWVSANVRQP